MGQAGEEQAQGEQGEPYRGRQIWQLEATKKVDNKELKM